MNNEDRIAALSTMHEVTTRFHLGGIVAEGELKDAKKKWLRILERTLSDFDALQCQVCSRWYPEHEIELKTDTVASPGATSLDDCTTVTTHVCKTCVEVRNDGYDG